MAARSGSDFINGLKARPRAVWVGGERVTDVTTHPAFSGSIEQIARLYDAQLSPELADTLTYVVPETGRRAGTAFMPAYSTQDLERRREAFRIWSEMTFGLMGRSPDFLNTTLLAMWESADVFGRGGAQFAQNVTNYYRYVRDNDLFLSHALITPQNDRSKSSSEQAKLHLRVVKETDAGIYMSGARMIATLGPIADELLMYNHPGMRPGDEDHAIVFAIPADTEGLRQIAREPYTLAGTKESFDHPLSTRFEEADALLIFDNVFVPWERVFVFRDVALCNAMYPDSAIRNHTAHQTNVRALVKFQFAVGVAMALARSIKADQFLHVQKMLGECLGYVEMIKSGLVRSEAEAEKTPAGTLRTSLPPLQALRTFMPTAYPRVIEVLQTIAAGGFMMMPTGADFRVPELGQDMDLYYQGADMASIDRVRLFKLAWDLAGEGFGQRLLQYERYYAGDPVRLLASNYLTYGDQRPDELVARALALAGDPRMLEDAK
ncbi:4-hydroxyphenylacetate 3-hydroxylase family protein [Sphingosinicella xenopeptidilytica]|uniref:4-hydroxyphenylacetate 3-hydroxylase family protein n=1 Tax=Sphingosinicella xenopeptidilytica TaxID=364098 RepID=A0ABW3C2E2_SPHXN